MIDIAEAFTRVDYRQELLDATPDQLRSLLNGLDAVWRSDTPALYELREWVACRLDDLELGDSENVVETKRIQGTTYRSELIKCGKGNCQCEKGGKLHGPYWYAYQRNGGKLRKKYIGKRNPSETADDQQAIHQAAEM